LVKLDDGLSPATVTKVHIVLHRALQMAVRWDYLPRNPADQVDRPSVPKRDLQALDPAELNRLLAVAINTAQRPTISRTQARADHQWAVLWALAINTGLRESELLALQWPDVDMDSRLISVRRNLVKAKQQRPQYGEPKSATSRRTVSIDAETVRLLRAHKSRQFEDRLAALDWAAFDLVFCSQIGTPLMRRNVLRAFKLAVGRAGLPESIRFHDLRHAHATLLLRAGVALKTASARLGHSGIAITADLYQHVAGDLDADAAQRVADVLRDKAVDHG
jgi:integrase